MIHCFYIFIVKHRTRGTPTQDFGYTNVKPVQKNHFCLTTLWRLDDDGLYGSTS